jgi:hypothetical protein
MPRWTKLLLAAIPAVLVAAAAGAWIALRAVDPATIFGYVAERVREGTGRVLAVRGAMDLSIWPRVALVADDVTFGNAGWGVRPEMIRAARVEVRVALWPLLRQRIEIDELRLVKPDVLLETDRDGRGNWEFGTAQPDRNGKDAATPVPALLAERIAVEDGRIAWRDGSSGRTTTLVVHALELREPRSAGETTATLAGSFRDQRFEAKASTDSLAAWMTRPRDRRVRVEATTPGAGVQIDATVVSLSPLAADAKVSLDIAGTEALAKLVGGAQALPVPASARAAWSAREDRHVLEGLEVSLRGQPIRGRLEVLLGGSRPTLKGSLHAQALDVGKLSAAQPPASETKPPAPETKPPAPETKPPAPEAKAGAARSAGPAAIALAALRAVDAQGDIGIDRMVLAGGQVLTNVRTRAALSGGRLALDPLEFGVFGGGVSGRFLVDAVPGRTAVLAVRARGTGLDGGQLARQAGVRSPVTGAPLSFSIDLAGPADSMSRLRAGLSGKVLVQVGQGRLGAQPATREKSDLDRVLETIDPMLGGGSGTQLLCAVARLEVKNGVAYSRRSVATETDRINAVYSGTVNLATEALDVAVRPSLRKGVTIGLASLAEVVRVRGTLTDPVVEIDTLDAARASISLGAGVATGGLSSLGEALLRRGRDDPNPCRTALAGGVRDAGAEGEAPAGQTPTDAVRELGDSVRRLLRR